MPKRTAQNVYGKNTRSLKSFDSNTLFVILRKLCYCNLNECILSNIMSMNSSEWVRVNEI